MKVINFSALACAALVSAQAIAAGPSYRNPAIFADCPDVSLCCDGKYYYMVSTTMHMVPGAPVMRSKDMLRWEMVGYVFDRFDFAPEFSFEDPNGKTAYSGGQWASSFKYHKGKFYCYFISNGHGGFLYTADKAEGPWKLHSREPFMHDASLLFDDDGKVWVFHGDGWLTLMNDDLTGVAPGWKNIRLFDRSDETALLEGSAAFKKDGWYYLMMVSAFMPNHPRRVIMLTTSDTEEDIFQAVKAGAMGYILKGAKPESLIAAIRRVADDEMAFPKEVWDVYKMRSEMRSVSPREKEVLELIAKGCSNQEIATMLGISPNSIKIHLKHIFEKLDVVDRAEAVATALRRGVIQS